MAMSHASTAVALMQPAMDLCLLCDGACATEQLEQAQSQLRGKEEQVQQLEQSLKSSQEKVCVRGGMARMRGGGGA